MMRRGASCADTAIGISHAADSRTAGVRIVIDVVFLVRSYGLGARCPGTQTHSVPLHFQKPITQIVLDQEGNTGSISGFGGGRGGASGGTDSQAARSANIAKGRTVCVNLNLIATCSLSVTAHIHCFIFYWQQLVASFQLGPSRFPIADHHGFEFNTHRISPFPASDSRRSIGFLFFNTGTLQSSHVTDSSFRHPQIATARSGSETKRDRCLVTSFSIHSVFMNSTNPLQPFGIFSMSRVTRSPYHHGEDSKAHFTSSRPSSSASKSMGLRLSRTGTFRYSHAIESVFRHPQIAFAMASSETKSISFRVTSFSVHSGVNAATKPGQARTSGFIFSPRQVV